MSHQICLRVPLLCMMVFSVIVGREQEDSRLYNCADMDCSEAISLAEGLNDFPALTPDKLPFRRHTKIEILGKPVDGSDHWIGRVGNQIGLVPSKLVQEQRILKTARYKQKFDKTYYDKLSKDAELQAAQNEKIAEIPNPSVITPVESIQIGESTEANESLVVVLEEENVTAKQDEGIHTLHPPQVVSPVLDQGSQNEKISEIPNPSMNTPEESLQIDESTKARSSPVVTPVESIQTNETTEATESLAFTPDESIKIPETSEASEPLVVTPEESALIDEPTNATESLAVPPDESIQINESETEDFESPEVTRVESIQIDGSIEAAESLVVTPDESIQINESTTEASESPEVTPVESIQIEESTETPESLVVTPEESIQTEESTETPESLVVTPDESTQIAESTEGPESLVVTPDESIKIDESTEATESLVVTPEESTQIDESTEATESLAVVLEEENVILKRDEEVHTHVHPPKVNPLLDHGTTAQECERTQNDHRHHHHHHHRHHEQEHQEEPSEYNFGNSVLVAMRYLSSTLVGFLPEYLQDTILDVKDSLVFTGIIALTLVSICVPYFFIELFLSVRPLKKKVTDLNKTLWKVSTAFENQQDEYDMYKEKALAYDEDKKQLEQLETELYLVKQIEIKLKTENRTLKKRINKDVKVAEELEALITKTINERDQVKDERDKFKSAIATLQIKLKETSELLMTARTDYHSKEMDLKLLTHTNENLELRGTVLEKEIGDMRIKLNTEIDLRRRLQTETDSLSIEKNSITEELLDLKSVLHKYEATVNSLNDEISVKENELLALKEVLGEDSPLVDIAEVTGKLKVAEGQMSSLEVRVKSITLENSSLTRDYEKAKETLETLQTEKDVAESKLKVLEGYFKEKEDELRQLVDKFKAEKETRGKDKDELIQMIEEKNDDVRDMTEMLENLKKEFEETKQAHRNEIRQHEAKYHETWLSLCQSERKAQEVRKESELLRQKLTTITKAKEADGLDALSSNGEVPFSFSQLDLDDIPLPLPDEPTLPSYFGLGDFEPPMPLDDDEDVDDEVLGIQQNHRRRHVGNSHEPQRPPPLGNYSDQEEDDDERDLSPIRGLGDRIELSDGSSSPPPEGHADGTESRENYMNGSLHSRRRKPINASSPFEQGVNL